MGYLENREKKYYVYKYTSPNGKSYIGRSCNPQQIRARWDGSGYKCCTAFWRAIEKYGWKNFSYEVLESGIDFEDIDARENYWITVYHSSTDENGYNLLKPSSEKGKTYSLETLRKLSYSHLHKAEREPAKDSNASSGKRFRFRPKTSDKTKEVLRQRCKCAHPVAQYDFNGNYIQTFSSRTEAAKAVGATKNTINSCCTGKIKSCKGYQWRDATENQTLKIEPYISFRNTRKVVS